MNGEQNLAALLRTMQPELHEAEFVFCTLTREQIMPPALTPVCVFQEAEGPTLIVPQAQAEAAGLPCVYPCRQITLTVHSSLEAVGFLARITTHLAAHGISVNPVSGYYHDHLFVPTEQAEEVLRLLGALGQTA